jgi:hypothetical protein
VIPFSWVETAATTNPTYIVTAEVSDSCGCATTGTVESRSLKLRVNTP